MRDGARRTTIKDSGSSKRFVERHLAPRAAADSHGLPWMSVDLGTRVVSVPNAAAGECRAGSTSCR